MAKLEVKGGKMLHHLIATLNEWREKYHVNEKNDIVFQNRETMANVRFTNHSLNAIRLHPKGFENIPQAIANPHEIWSKWKDAGIQKVTLRSYILFGKGFAYVVLTEDGHIEDALAISSRSAEKYRKGVILKS